MPLQIEVLNTDDIDRIAKQMIHAEHIVFEITSQSLSGKIADLQLIQRVLDTNLIEPEATYSLQALGIAFGKVYVNAHSDYDWWIAEDEYGRDPAIRYKETTILVFPQTIISKRIEDKESVDIKSLYDGLHKMLEDIIIATAHKSY